MAVPCAGSGCGDRQWTEDKERALIHFFSENSCLWNHRSESYNNRQLRWKTLEHLQLLLSSLPPPVNFSVDDIKSKFRNLRTTFQRQSKMVKASREGGAEEVFVPQWKHYQQLLFLQEEPGGGGGGPGGGGGGDFTDLLLSSTPLTPQKEESSSKLVLASSAAATTFVSFLPKASISLVSDSTSVSPVSTSCASSHVMARCYWTGEKERALIAFYREHSCLWNRKCENHKNRQLRLKLLETLRIRLSDNTVTFSVDDVKCKFKSLRTVFHRELRAVRNSRTSEQPYVSRWRHYQQLLFLSEDEDHPEVMTFQEETEPHGEATPPPALLDRFSGEAKYQILLTASPDPLRPAPAPSPSDTKPCLDLLGGVCFGVSGPPEPDPRPNLELDPRPNPESRSYWSEAKVQQLISFYSEHSCLWNHRSDSYKNRLLRLSLLETLSRLLSEDEPVAFTVDDIKTKFKNLRTIFQRELKAANNSRTCGSEDFYLPKWRYFRELMFLCDEELLPFPVQTPPTPALLYHGSLHAQPSPTPPDSRLTSPTSSSSSSGSRSDGRAPGRKRSGQRGAPSPCAGHQRASPSCTGHQLLDIARMLCQSPSSPHAGFLKYVEECLNETPPEKVKRLKKNILETIHSF